MRSINRACVFFLAAAGLCFAFLVGQPVVAQEREPAASSQRGYLGVELRDVTVSEAETLGWRVARGTVVRNIKADSPAAAANLSRGDIVVSAGGRRVRDTSHFLEIIGAKTPGTKMAIEVIRRGKLRSGTVALGAKPVEQVAETPDTRETGGLREEAEAYMERREGSRAENLEKAFAAAGAALELSSREKSPEQWGAAQLTLGKVLAERIRGNRADNLERAIAAYDQALTVYTREASPHRWAEVQHHLGAALTLRKRGDMQDNIARAITAYEAALTVRTREAAPADWAASQHGLAIARRMNTRGDRAENIERAVALFEAALTVRTRETAPREWAETRHHLAIAYRNRMRGDKAENLERAIALYNEALTVRTRETYPADWAATQNNLGYIHTRRVRGDKAENVERAIAYFEAALTVRTREAFPEDWAATQAYLADAYENRVLGVKAENLERIAAAYEAALSVFDADTYPRERASYLHFLGMAYAGRESGSKEENLERAIAALEEAVPLRAKEPSRRNWAFSQYFLASLYDQRMRGDPAENLDRAIAAYEAVLPVFTREAYPAEWGTAQMYLGSAYSKRSRGSRAENIERAIVAFEAAGATYTGEASLGTWGLIQLSLGNLYYQRVRGERAENIERAVAIFEAAAPRLTQERQPGLWRLLQQNLGLAYSSRVHGDHAENIERAIALTEQLLAAPGIEANAAEWATANYLLASVYSIRKRGTKDENTKKAVAALEATLKFYTREAHPLHWAKTQALLALQRAHSIDGNSNGDVKPVIALLEAALTVFDREAHPTDWALARLWLGSYYADARLGEAQDLDRAIAASRDALTVFTIDASPSNHRHASHNLGKALLKKRDWRGAETALGSAREAFSLLFGEGLNETGARAIAGDDLFTDAAYAAAKLGEPERAFALLDEGKARLLGVALKLHTLRLGQDEQERLQVLRRQIREGEAAYEVLTGDEKSAKVAAVAKMRAEVLTLVTKGSPPALTQGEFLQHIAEVIPEGGALAAPLYASDDKAFDLPSFFMLATVRDGKVRISAVEMPEETPDRREAVMAAFKDWARIYKLNSLSGAERDEAMRVFPKTLKKIAPALWRVMGGPLTEALHKEGVKTGAPIVVLPTGATGLIPFGLAQDPDSGRMLMDGHPVAYAPSIAALVSAKERAGRTAAAPGLTAIVNPTGDLAFTPVEAALVTSRFDKGQQTIVAQEAATPEAVLAALNGRDYWHFATHGFFDWENALESGLLLAGKKPLTVRALLKAEGLKGPRLAVLSACETGVYDVKRGANEFTGLPAAFLQAGAGGVVSSLWPVDDLSTALLMAKFYDIHRSDGRPPVHALRDAQVWLRDATGADLRAYARQAVAEGRLPRELADQLRGAMTRSAASRGLVDSIVALMGGAGKLANTDADGGQDRPFAHPYYWSGFILTGM